MFIWRFMEVWRAIPDVLGRGLSEAKPAEEGGCTPLLGTKYEPDMVIKDRDIEVGNRMENKHAFGVFGVSDAPRR